MIQLTRLNNTRLAVNSDLIKYVEQAPDTVITLVNDEKLVVRESAEEVIDRFREFRRSVLAASHFDVSEGSESSSAKLTSAEKAKTSAGFPCG